MKKILVVVLIMAGRVGAEEVEPNAKVWSCVQQTLRGSGECQTANIAACILQEEDEAKREEQLALWKSPAGRKLVSCPYYIVSDIDPEAWQIYLSAQRCWGSSFVRRGKAAYNAELRYAKRSGFGSTRRLGLILTQMNVAEGVITSADENLKSNKLTRLSCTGDVKKVAACIEDGCPDGTQPRIQALAELDDATKK